MKKILPSLIVAFGVLFLGNSVSAEEVKEYGGWSDDNGYYQNNETSNKSNKNSLFAGPPDHQSSAETKAENNAGYERVVAKTDWPGVYHYSQAWYQHRVTGGKKASNRVWGTGNTVAKSGWVAVNVGNNAMYQRRTSYGSE